MIGETISNYKIIAVIGEGGMGIVYLSEHVIIGRKAAIKALHKKYLGNNNIKERFKNEAATLSQIEHPNIVKLYDYVENDKGLFLIMEYVDGVLLDEYIKKESGPINEENAIKIMKGLLAGFAYAHSKNIVHRDVKPNNVIISRDFQTVKILDFGIAKILDDNSRNFTKDGTQMGTVYYMSPEQVRGQAIDKRSDIYSLGVSFFQMITGINPYEKITTEFEIYNKITQEELPAAQDIYPYASSKLDAIIKKSTQKNPKDRYQNCEQILIDLKNGSILTPNLTHPNIEKNTTNLNIHPTENNQSKKGIKLGVFVGLLSILILTLLIFNFSKGKQINEVPEIQITTDTIPIIDGTEEDYITTNEIVNKYVTDIRLTYSNDIFLYTGEIDGNGMANGYGIAKYIDEYSNGEIYEGYFLNNMKEGKGIYKWPDGSYYDGSFENNKRNGCGTYFDVSTETKTYGKFIDDDYIGKCN